MLYALHINNIGLRESIEFYIRNILRKEVIVFERSIDDFYLYADKIKILILDSSFPGNKHIEALKRIKRHHKHIETYLLMSNMEKNIYEDLYKQYVDKFINESEIQIELK